MHCEHEGFHTITSSYQPRTRILTYLRRCEECGADLAEVARIVYEPRFEPGGTSVPYRLQDSGVATRGD